MVSNFSTCFVSRSPIKPNDKVRLFFIASKKPFMEQDFLRSSIFNNSNYYVWDNFRILGGIGISAIYNDYNTYTFDNTSLSAKIIFKIIEDNFINYTKEESKNLNNPFSHIGADKLNFSIIQKMINNDTLYINPYQNNTHDFVKMIAVHEDIYQLLINEATSYYNYETDLEEYKYVSDHINNIILNYNEKQEIIHKSMLKLLKVFNYSENGNNDGSLMSKKDAEKLALDMAKSSIYNGEENTSPYALFGFSILGDDTFLNSLSLSSIDEILSLLGEYQYFINKLDKYNISLIPTASSKQEENYFDLSKLYENFASILKNKSCSENFVQTTLYSHSWQEILLSDVEKFFEYYEKDNKHYLQFIEFKNKYSQLGKMIIGKNLICEVEFNFLKMIIQDNAIEIVFNFSK